MRKVVIVSAVRTPVGKKGGALRDFKRPELAGMAMKEALRRVNMDGTEIDDVIFGGIGAVEYRGPARHFWLEAGLPIQVPGLTINRACSTSLTGIALAAAQIMAGFGDTYLVGGVEMDSRPSYVLVNDFPYKAGQPVVSTGYFSPQAFGNEPMTKTAENVAQRFGITRKECDEYALRSYELAEKGYEEGLYPEHVIPIKLPGAEARTMVRDEVLRKTSTEQLSALKPVLGGVVTAGNASPLNDGASAAVVMLEEKARAMGLTPLLRFVDYSVVGVDPRIMGIGPVPAMKRLLCRNKMSIGDLDFIECNEAFAVQTLAVSRELGIEMDRLNIRGGAIALGHPGSATGVSLVAKASGLMKRIQADRCAITFCNGGGMGVAVMFENCT